MINRCDSLRFNLTIYKIFPKIYRLNYIILHFQISTIFNCIIQLTYLVQNNSTTQFFVSQYSTYFVQKYDFSFESNRHRAQRPSQCRNRTSSTHSQSQMYGKTERTAETGFSQRTEPSLRSRNLRR